MAVQQISARRWRAALKRARCHVQGLIVGPDRASVLAHPFCSDRSMHRSDLTISFISDEVSAALDEALTFAQAQDIRAIDLRVIDGRNVLSLAHNELAGAAQRVRA